MRPQKDLYGTRPGGLNKLLNSLTEDQRREVVLLTRAENDQMTSASLTRFPLTRDGVDWDRCRFIEQHSIVDVEEAAQVTSQIIGDYVRDDSLVVALWDNLIMPSLALSARTAAMRARQLLDTSWGVWLFIVDEKLIIEYLGNEFVTLGKIQEGPNGSMPA